MFRKKVEWKLRYYYLQYFHKSVKNSWMYPAVRHVGKVKKKIDKKTEVEKGANVVTQYITKLVNPTAGIGDQLASFNTGYFYAKLLDLGYAYSPLYPQSWNDFMGFHNMVADAEVLCKKEGYRKIRLPCFEHKSSEELQFLKEIIQSYKDEKVVFYIENNQVYGEQYGVASALREKFNKASARSNDKLIYDNGIINIAVHVRRGDITVGQLNQNPELVMRWLDNDYYVKVLQQLVDIIKGECLHKIYLFSQGNIEEFAEFKQFDNLVYCLDMGAQDSFLHLVRADVIVTSKSSFSYKPALLARGLRICPKHFWHDYPEEEKWIIVDERESKLSEEAMKIIRQFVHGGRCIDELEVVLPLVKI